MAHVRRAVELKRIRIAACIVLMQSLADWAGAAAPSATPSAPPVMYPAAPAIPHPAYPATSSPIARPPGTSPRSAPEPGRPAQPAETPRPREVLPATIVPVHYDLALAPDTEHMTFKGSVAITINALLNAPAVTLNAAGLTIDRAVVDDGQPAQVALDDRLGRATLTFAGPILIGEHVLVIDYHGSIGQKTLGFFAMDYSSPDGPRRTLATNFEPAAARELLPCWDEPARKATFTISVDAPKDRMTLSNMPVAQITPLSATMQRVRFAQSPEMSTYLLFIAIGDFERIHDTVDGVDLGIVVKRGDTAKAAYALDQAAKLLHFYNDYFGIAYSLPKLDLIAAPGQIDGGSMENWGAIFYSQDHLLFDPATSTEADRQAVFLVVSHEMSHQWFGDLVTMAWWDNLWLNEGFARWMQTFAADELHPEWETGLKAAAILEEGKQADAIPSTHPVVQQVSTADQAAELFDSITYDKGAAVITMINAYVGREKFREGVRRYMRAHAFGNTVDADLWRPIEAAVGRPVMGIEQDFTQQEGLPLVTVTSEAKGMRLLQSRFLDDTASLADVPPQRWRLPLAISPVGGAAQYLLLQGAEDLPLAPPVLVNAGQTGYARVRYVGDTFYGLAQQIAALAPVDQLGLINDASALAVARAAPVSNLLRIVSGLPANGNPIVWGRVLGLLSTFDLHYEDGPARGAYRRFALDLLAPLAATIGPDEVPNESASVSILRADLGEVQGRFGAPEVIDRARQLTGHGGGSPSQQRAALDIVAAQADTAAFDALLAKARGASDPLAKLRYFRALAGVMDPELARRMIDIALGDQVPAGAAPGLVSRLAHRHPDIVWDMLAPRLDDPELPWSKPIRWHVAKEVAGESARSERIADLRAYEARSVPPDARKPFLESEASIRQNQRIAREMLPEIDRWIALHPSAAQP